MTVIVLPGSGTYSGSKLTELFTESYSHTFAPRLSKGGSAMPSMATSMVFVPERSGVAVTFESVGGVDAARRVQAGEPFDVVVLAADAIDRLVEAGSVVAGSRTDLVRSEVAVAVPAGTPRPDIGSEFGEYLRSLDL